MDRPFAPRAERQEEREAVLYHDAIPAHPALDVGSSSQTASKRQRSGFVRFTALQCLVDLAPGAESIVEGARRHCRRRAIDRALAGSRRLRRCALLRGLFATFALRADRARIGGLLGRLILLFRRLGLGRRL